MSLTLNPPPDGTIVSEENPTVEELAARSNNTLSGYKRSFDGRSLVRDLNGFRLTLPAVRQTLTDIYANLE